MPRRTDIKKVLKYIRKDFGLCLKTLFDDITIEGTCTDENGIEYDFVVGGSDGK
jgi:hypothetical protein